jgi:carboxyl-terminal processing protease
MPLKKKPPTRQGFSAAALAGWVVVGLFWAAPLLARTDADTRLLKELLASLHASYIDAPTFEGMTLTGLEAVAAEKRCLQRLTRKNAIHLRCGKNGRGQRFDWPPQNASDSARILISTVKMVAPGKKDRQALLDGLARHVVAALGDPFTAYIPADAVSRFDKLSATDMATPGLELSPLSPQVVREVRPGSDAAKAGIHRGDTVLKVEGQKVREMTLAELNLRMMGMSGSRIDVRIRREATGEEDDLTLTRTLAPEAALRVQRVVPGVVYVRVAAFTHGLTRLLKRRLLRHRVDALIVDLRHNPGGLLEEGVAFLDLFLGDGRIGGVRPRPGLPSDDFDARSQRSDLDVPMVVLVDGAAASVSELVSMALQERRRATIVGAPTLGKGSVQRVIDLPTGARLRVTVAHYVGPRGRPLGHSGIRPDHVLSPPAGRTVLNGAPAQADGWVLYGLDLIERQAGTGPQRRTARGYGPMP